MLPGWVRAVFVVSVRLLVGCHPKPPAVPRSEVIDELYRAIVDDVAPLHDGAWAMATMEVVFAILRSAREGCDVTLSYQVALA
jgi:phthalate 4,5-cis-dihydrodiol dehydrogenase